jgi:endonuclease III-like uncharacterized protein
MDFLDQHFRGSINRLFMQPSNKLRGEFLSLPGVRPETAGVILLYAGVHPVFVVDAYTRRIASRHGILPANTDYEESRQPFERELGGASELRSLTPASRSSSGGSHTSSPMGLVRSPVAQAFSEMHGPMVGAGKNYCLKSQAHCGRRPLEPLLEKAWTARGGGSL